MGFKMIVKSGKLIFTGNHSYGDKDGDIYQLRITHDGLATITGDFNTEEVTSIIEGLTDMILVQVANEGAGESKFKYEVGEDGG